MIYVRPDYYHKFKCVADQCEATCCAGWQIVIDENSLERYKAEESAYGETLRNRIDWEEGVFFQDQRKRCAFLKENNLCEMYEQLGEESLCLTCTNYPRHIEEFENIREVTLAISCPEVAKIILAQKEPVQFVEEELEGEDEEFEDFDPFFFSYLEDARQIMLSILQNRSLSMDVRMGFVRKMAEEMQEVVEEGDLFELADVFERYEEADSLKWIIGELDPILEQYHESREAFLRLNELEHLSEGWEDYLARCINRLYEKGEDSYRELHRSFRESMDQTDMEILLEQLMVYFVFTYFCGAVYDGNVIGKVKMAVDSVHCIYEMLAAKWAENGGSLSEEETRNVVYRYSRELEHSDENLELMQQDRF